MGIADVLWMTLILGGAGYLLYRSVWKKKGHCQGCDNAGCSKSDLSLATAQSRFREGAVTACRAAPPCTLQRKAEYL